MRPRIHALSTDSHGAVNTNTARQKAYRARKAAANPQTEIPVTIPHHVDPTFVREAIDQGVSVGYAAKQLGVSRKVVRAYQRRISKNSVVRSKTVTP